MQEIQDDLKIYSEEVRDVLSSPPNAIFKWGNTILLGFIIVLGLISWFIQYPDIVRAQVMVTTQEPPEKLVARTSGKISEIWRKNQEKISANTPIALIENASNYENVFLLKKILDTLKMQQPFYFPIDNYSFDQLGSIENSFTNFKNYYLNYKQYEAYNPHRIAEKTQKNEISQQAQRIQILQQQIIISTQELKLKKNELERFKHLFAKGVISKQELENQEYSYLQLEKNHRNLTTQLSNLKSNKNELNRTIENTQISEFKDNINFYQQTIQAFNQLKRDVAEWELQYVIKSSITGKLSYLQVWSKNQVVNQGQVLFSIVPDVQNNFVAKLLVPNTNAGKIKLNQEVIIRLANFPDREFGVLKGKITAISLTPNQDGFLLIDATLPNNLQTTYHKTITFQQEMNGVADIVTDDLRLIERLLYQFRDIFTR